MRRVGTVAALAVLAGSLSWLAVLPGASPRLDQQLTPTPEIRQSIRRRSPVPPPPESPGSRLFYDGTGWRSLFWASDLLRVHVAPGADPAVLVPGAVIMGWDGVSFTARVNAMDLDGFRKRARELRARTGVRAVLPAFYLSAGALEKRSGPVLYLTPQVLATLPAGTGAETVAARLGVLLISTASFQADTHLFQAPEPFAALDLASTLIEKEAAASAIPQFIMLPRTVRRRDTTVTDPNYSEQWHLKNTGQGGGKVGEDVRAEVAWDYTFGAGAVITVIDTGSQYAHPDLSANYLPSASWDFDDNDSDPAPAPYQAPIGGVDINDDHGTAVAGVAAAVNDNALGGTGIAPQAKFGAIRLISQIAAPSGISDFQVAQAMSFANNIIDIKTNSWSFVGDGTIDAFPHSADLNAIGAGWATGRGGKGVIYLFAAGNSADLGDDVNYSGFCTRREVITVGASDNTGVKSFYSNPGAALLVVAPSDGGTLGITTTDRTGTDGYNTSAGTAGDYTVASGPSAFGGTSSATPLAAGVVALMLSANPNLSSRDVQHVLVRTARKLDGGSPTWMTNGAGRLVSHDYGHGCVDAGAAVQLAQRFPYAKGEHLVSQAASPNTPIPDSPPSGGSGGLVTSTLTFGSSGALRIEHVEVVINIAHTYIGDLRIRLVHANPSGPSVTSTFANVRADGTQNYVNWHFMSTLHWGETSQGDWTLEVDDLANLDSGTLQNWTLNIYGTPIDTAAPVAGTVKDGSSGPDLAFQNDATTINANWSGFTDALSTLVYEWAIGTTPGGIDIQDFKWVPYATSASATGLSLSSGTTYYVTVRATNFDGLQCSATSNGVLVDTQPPLSPASPGVTPVLGNTGNLHVSWSTPTDPGGSGVVSYVVQRSVNGGAFATIATVGTTSYDDLSLGNGSYQYQIQAVDGAGNAGSFSSIAGPAVVDKTAPNTSITGMPPNPSGQENPTFTFSATEANCTFQYNLDGAGWVSNGLSTTVNLLGLSPGSHTFKVFATDAAGNADSTPASYSWSIPRIISDSAAPFLNSFDSAFALSNWTMTSTGTPKWAVDATPGTILGSAHPYASAPSSLNYNDGTNYQTGTSANSGTATSPLVDISALPATGWLKFMCNFDTDTAGMATDKRFIRIMSPDLITTRDTLQFSGSGAAPLGCGPAGIWHEHAIPFNAAWTPTFKLQIVFDTVDGTANTGAGWFIDDLEFSDLLVTGLNQYSAGAIPPIPLGGAAAGNSIEFRGLISTAASGLTQVEVEVKAVGTAFDGIGTMTAQGLPGASVSVQATIPTNGNYHWRARTQPMPAGTPSGWMEFGVNPTGDIDFKVTNVGGSGGGGGGCGATGWEAVALFLLVRRLRRRLS